MWSGVGVGVCFVSDGVLFDWSEPLTLSAILDEIDLDDDGKRDDQAWGMKFGYPRDNRMRPRGVSIQRTPDFGHCRLITQQGTDLICLSGSICKYCMECISACRSPAGGTASTS